MTCLLRLPQVRGAVMLPHGTGRSVRVGVFASGEDAAAATAAGAHIRPSPHWAPAVFFVSQSSIEAGIEANDCSGPLGSWKAERPLAGCAVCSYPDLHRHTSDMRSSVPHGTTISAACWSCHIKGTIASLTWLRLLRRWAHPGWLSASRGQRMLTDQALPCPSTQACDATRTPCQARRWWARRS